VSTGLGPGACSRVAKDDWSGREISSASGSAEPGKAGWGCVVILSGGVDGRSLTRIRASKARRRVSTSRLMAA